MAGKGKFNHVVQATSHMRSGPDATATERAGEQVPESTEPQRSLSEGQKGPGPGRPRNGKRSNPGFQQVTALLPSDLYARAKVRLIEEKAHGDFSELLRGLLENWLLVGGRGPHERR